MANCARQWGVDASESLLGPRNVACRYIYISRLGMIVNWFRIISGGALSRMGFKLLPERLLKQAYVESMERQNHAGSNWHLYLAYLAARARALHSFNRNKSGTAQRIDELLELLERMFQNEKKCELFALLARQALAPVLISFYVLPIEGAEKCLSRWIAISSWADPEATINKEELMEVLSENITDKNYKDLVVQLRGRVRQSRIGRETKIR